jgi:hypothetical protein
MSLIRDSRVSPEYEDWIGRPRAKNFSDRAAAREEICEREEYEKQSAALVDQASKATEVKGRAGLTVNIEVSCRYRSKLALHRIRIPRVS